jgi:hypothetical protein
VVKGRAYSRGAMWEAREDGAGCHVDVAGWWHFESFSGEVEACGNGLCRCGYL